MWPRWLRWLGRMGRPNDPLRQAIEYDFEEDRLWAHMRWNLGEDPDEREAKINKIRVMHSEREK